MFFKLSCWAALSGRRIDRPWPACQLDSAAQQESSKNKTVLGHPAGPFQKSNCTRPPRGRTVYLDFFPRPPSSVSYSIVLPGQWPWLYDIILLFESPRYRTCRDASGPCCTCSALLSSTSSPSSALASTSGSSSSSEGGGGSTTKDSGTLHSDCLFVCSLTKYTPLHH